MVKVVENQHILTESFLKRFRDANRKIYHGKKVKRGETWQFEEEHIPFNKNLCAAKNYNEDHGNILGSMEDFRKKEESRFSNILPSILRGEDISPIKPAILRAMSFMYGGCPHMKVFSEEIWNTEPNVRSRNNRPIDFQKDTLEFALDYGLHPMMPYSECDVIVIKKENVDFITSDIPVIHEPGFNCFYMPISPDVCLIAYRLEMPQHAQLLSVVPRDEVADLINEELIKHAAYEVFSRSSMGRYKDVLSEKGLPPGFNEVYSNHQTIIKRHMK